MTNELTEKELKTINRRDVYRVFDTTEHFHQWLNNPALVLYESVLVFDRWTYGMIEVYSDKSWRTV